MEEVIIVYLDEEDKRHGSDMLGQGTLENLLTYLLKSAIYS